MKLSAFIRNNIEAILLEWEKFADSIQPETGDMDSEDLRDHAKRMLEEVADDLDLPESKHQQVEKSKGQNPKTAFGSAAKDHGLERMRSGFDIIGLVGEYRYMRATVIRLWAENNHLESLDPYDLIRFNEALDKLIYEAVGSFSAECGRQARLFDTVLSSDHGYILGPDCKFIYANKPMLQALNISPLQAVMTILHTFKKWGELDRVYLDLAISESCRMKNLIASLQDFNHPSVGDKILTDVHASIDSVLMLCKSDFRLKRISTVLNCVERLPRIMAIPDQIKQVLLNLLNNAADACVPNGGEITISTWQEEQKVAIAIQDTGVGIHPEKLSLIFQPFYTTKPEVKGTGLGLSICHSIIQAHNGEIRVESQPGKGSTFTVLLPIK